MRAMAGDLPATHRTKVLSEIGGTAPQSATRGPTKCLLDQEGFDHVRLLSTYPKTFNRWFAKWVGVPVEVAPVQLEDVTNYGEVFRVTDEQLSSLRGDKRWANAELCLHLSPGTPTMAAVLLLLGKTRYPATFYQTYQSEAWVTDVPFQLVDVIPDLLHGPDVHLQDLASRAPADIAGFEGIVGNSRPIREAVGRAQRAAIRSVSVLLLGESGTGKEMFAKAIHQASPRSGKPFIAINCAAISKTLLESELFGHKKGAFTDAKEDRKGAFEQAHGGTLFLDEVGECDRETQAKLLRVLQPLTGQGASIRTVTRLGESRERTVDVRIVAATNRNLHHAITAGQFREDLYYRLAAVTIKMPPLRERRGDTKLIAERLLEQINEQFAREEHGYQHKSFSASAIQFVRSHAWPGNVRQLYNAIVQAAVFTDGQKIGRPELEAAVGEFLGAGSSQSFAMDHPLGDGFSIETHLSAIQKHYLERAMKEAEGSKTAAARLLGMKHYQTLDAQLERLGVETD